MAQEQEKEPVQLTHVGLDLTTGVGSLIGLRDDELVRFRFYLPPGLHQLLTTYPPAERAARTLLTTGQAEPEEPIAAESQRSAAFFQSSPVDGTFSSADLARAHPENKPGTPTPQEKSPTVALPGILHTKPVEGRLDRHGKPTATAQFLAHMEGQEGAVRLFTTFHESRRTREIALSLDRGAQITAQGYLHLKPPGDTDPGRSSTFSVIHLISYPGKPQRGQSS